MPHPTLPSDTANFYRISTVTSGGLRHSGRARPVPHDQPTARLSPSDRMAVSLEY